MTRLLIIPAAGRGTRLGFDGPKALCPVAGRPMIAHLLDLYAGLAGRFVIVTAPAALPIFRWALDRSGHDIDFVVQPEPTGMLPAILCAHDAVAAHRPEQVWITWCDQIGISADTIARVSTDIDRHPEAGLVLPTVRQAPPYIHLERDAGGRIVRVRQRREGDEMPAEGESDAGLFALRLDPYLHRLVEYDRGVQSAGSGTGERNFLPFIPWLAARMPVRTVELANAAEAIGVNTPDDVRTVEAHLRERR